MDIQTLNTEIYSKLSWFKQARVRAAKIMVVGCGALGNEVLKNLALFGVEHLVVVDYDLVEASNLTRSILFSHEDAVLGRSKVEVVGERLKQINPVIKVKCIMGDIAHHVGLGVIRDMDVVIGCVDNRLARYQLNRLCMRAGIAWVDGAIDGLEGTVRVFAPGQNCYACNLGPEGLKELSYRLSCASVIRRHEAEGRVATTPVVASIIGAVQVQEALKLLLTEELLDGKLTSLCGKMFYYEGEHLTTRVVDFKAYDEECPVHEQWEPIVPSKLHRGMSVEEVLRHIKHRLDVDKVSISLRDFTFVDYLIERATDKKYPVMLPSYQVAHYVENHPQLSQFLWNTLYQHEYFYINDNFPYKMLTFEEVGIPSCEILHVETNKGNFYLETL